MVISEINFDPTDPDGNGRLRARDFEFIELHNQSDEAVPLGGWLLEGSTEFEFPQDARLDAGATLLVVGFNPSSQSTLASFQFLLSADESATFYGRYRPRLEGEPGSLRLVRPGRAPVDQPEFVPTIIEDSIVYRAGGIWPTSVAGEGNSLHRTQPADDGESSISWIAESAVAWFGRLFRAAGGRCE